jgi:hypothetical protein
MLRRVDEFRGNLELAKKKKNKTDRTAPSHDKSE